jgi:phage-related minor tail protein
MTETVLDTLLVQVRTDTRAATQGIDTMRRDLDLLGVGADSAARRMENAFERFVRTGKFNFESLRQLALGVLVDIAGSALRSGIDGLLGSLGGGKSGGHGGLLTSLLASLGLPGRATGGLVSAQKPYLVGERGPELFVPHQAGRIETRGAAGRSISITVNVAGGADARSMTRSANQVAVAVRRSLDRAERLA